MKRIVLSVLALVLLASFFVCYFFWHPRVAAPQVCTVNADVCLQSCDMWDGTALPAMQLQQPEVSVLRITIDPGVKLGSHLHALLNVGYVTRGELTVTSKEGQQLVLHAGDALVELVNKYHYGENTGKEPVEIIVFYLGEKGTPLSEYEP